MVTIQADHWSEIDREWWDKFSPFFSPKELASKGDGSLVFSVSTLIRLNELRKLFGKPLIINSGYRDEEYNTLVGGSKNSQHKLGTAVDIHVVDHRMGHNLEQMAKAIGFKGIGRYKTFIHIDTRKTPAEWGEWNVNNTLTS